MGTVALLVLGAGVSQALGILGGDGSHPQAAATQGPVGHGEHASATRAALSSTTTTVPTTTTTEVPTTTTVSPATTTEAPTTSTPPSPTTTVQLPAATATETTSSDVVNATNQDRAANGLAMLTPDPQLTSLAQSWANHLATIGALDHQDLEGLRTTSMTNWLSLGENCLYGPENMGAREMESVWMSDSGHRDNILRPQMNFVGVGIARDGAGRVWVVVDFGRR